MIIAQIDDNQNEAYLLADKLSEHDIRYYNTYNDYMLSPTKHDARLIDFNMPDYAPQFLEHLLKKEDCLTYILTGGNVDFFIESTKSLLGSQGVDGFLNKDKDADKLKRYLSIYEQEAC